MGECSRHGTTALFRREGMQNTGDYLQGNRTWELVEWNRELQIMFLQGVPAGSPSRGPQQGTRAGGPSREPEQGVRAGGPSRGPQQAPGVVGNQHQREEDTEQDLCVWNRKPSRDCLSVGEKKTQSVRREKLAVCQCKEYTLCQRTCLSLVWDMVSDGLLTSVCVTIRNHGTGRKELTSVCVCVCVNLIVCVCEKVCVCVCKQQHISSFRTSIPTHLRCIFTWKPFLYLRGCIHVSYM